MTPINSTEDLTQCKKQALEGEEGLQALLLPTDMTTNTLVADFTFKNEKWR